MDGESEKVPVYSVEDVFFVMLAEARLKIAVKEAVEHGARPGDGSEWDLRAQEAQINLNALRRQAYGNSRANAVERPVEDSGT